MRNHQQTSKKKTSWFERHSKTTIILTILIFTIFIDWSAGLIFIPKDYNVFRCPHPYYHHDLIPNIEVTAKWGNIQYPMFTNSLGFRDSAVRTIALQTPKKRILFIGDSFAEGLGVPYPKTFVGILEEKLNSSNTEILNASVVSYSPKLYHLKIKYLLEKKGLHFDELIVFIDISDIQNELVYKMFEPSEFVKTKKALFNLKKFLKKTSFFYYSLAKLFQNSRDSHLKEFASDGLFPCFAGLDKELLNNKDFRRADSQWTLDAKIFNKFGKKGLQLAGKNMQMLVNLCKKKYIHLAIVVYPWPHQIRYRDLKSIQVKFWRKFAATNSIMFVNLFPEFIDHRSYDRIYKTYFIQGDVHWNAVGHQMVAMKLLEYLRQEISD